MDELITLIREPVKSIAKAKNRNMMRTYKLLLAEWIIIILAFLAVPLAAGSVMGLEAIVATFVMGIVLTLFFGYLMTLAMKILGGKGDFYHGLTVLVYTVYPLSLGALVMSIVSLTASLIAMLLGLIIVSVLAVMSFAMFFRTIMDLFRVDAIRAFIVFQMMFLEFYILLILGMAGASAFLGSAATLV